MWYVLTFIVGCFFGMVIMALCAASGRDARQSERMAEYKEKNKAC